MQFTYKQIKDALYKVYLKEFETENGRQPLVKYDCLSDVPMSDMVYLLNSVGNRDSVEIE